ATPRGCATPSNALPEETTLYVFGDERVTYGPSTDACVPTTPTWIKYPTSATKIESLPGQPAKTYVLLKDHLGSTRLVADLTGAVVPKLRYAPYGSQTVTQSSTATRDDKAFIDQRLDETGLLYLNARYYDPRVARFASPDWWEPQLTGVGTNRY